MTDKDPKDMTASELLRKATMRETDEWGNITPHVKLYSALSGEDAAATDYVERGDLLRQLADKIDAELAQARNESLLQGAQVWAKANGWPDFREGEDFGAWLDRCALPRPRFDDGEPVQQDDLFQVGCGLTAYANFALVALDGSCYWLFDDWDGELTDDRIKRPAPEVLGADGKPIKAGETVYRTDAPITEAVVVDFRKYDDGSIDVVCSEKDGKVTAFYSPSILTHTPPETQERIDDDVTLPPREYYNAHIGHDVGLKDDEEVAVAMVLDLLRRQRELDKRTGGE